MSTHVCYQKTERDEEIVCDWLTRDHKESHHKMSIEQFKNGETGRMFMLFYGRGDEEKIGDFIWSPLESKYNKSPWHDKDCATHLIHSYDPKKEIVITMARIYTIDSFVMDIPKFV